MKNLRTVLFLVSTMLILFLITNAQAQVDEATENRVRKIAHQLRCPTCQSQSVKESEAGLSVNMKSKIREMIQAGKSDTEILDYFVVRYGEWILRSPTKSGFNLLLWILPIIIIFIATFVLYISLKKKKISPAPTITETVDSSTDKEISKRFEEVFKD